MSTDSRIPISLISGFLGAGKTTLLRHFLSQKPTHENWGILINEFGQVGIDADLLPDTSNIMQIAGGCICCTTAPLLRVNLNRLIQKKPDRILVELSGLGHPAGVINLLNTPSYQQIVRLASILGVVDLSLLSNPNYAAHPLFQEQLSAAHVLMGSKADTLSESVAWQRLANVQQHLALAHTALTLIRHGKADLRWLDGAVERATPLPFISSSKPRPYKITSPVQRSNIGEWEVHFQQGDFYSISYHATLSAPLTMAQLFALASVGANGLWRLKGILHTQQGWKSLNCSTSSQSIQSTSPTIKSKMVLLCQTADLLHLQQVIFSILG